MEEYDIADIKQEIDCRNVAGQYLGPPLQRSGRASQWNCPFHEDYATPSFTAYSDGYKCFGCGAHGDQIDLVMALEQVGFVQAVEYLTGHAPVGEPTSLPSVRKQRAGRRASWQEPWWQQDAHKLVADGTQRLAGSPGADYLAQRGISPEACQAFALGYEPHVLIKAKQGREWAVVEDLGSAIIIPWQANGVIKAVQYRLIEHPTRRFHQKFGGERTLFGVHLLAGRDVLVIVEGELNAVSIWQAAHDLVNVVSFGPEGNVDQAMPYLRRAVQRYEHILVWADKPQRALSALQSIGRDGIALRSPRNLDANDLLQRGLLTEFVAKVLRKRMDDVPTTGGSTEEITVIFPTDAHPATVHGKWQRLDDGRIEASYTPAELLWARAVTGYEPTAEELAVMADL